MSVLSPPRLRDLPIPLNYGDPRNHYGITTSFPPIPPSYAESNRRFQPTPLNATPYDLFHLAQNTCTVPGFRFIRKNNQRQMMMFCDGACSHNGAGGGQSRGGCGIVLTSGNGISYSLGNDGFSHTSNRAELEAVILALGLRYWPGEGFQSVVIATDSEYVVLGITQWMRNWIQRGWRTATGAPVANQDLWQALRDRLGELEGMGCHVQFWWIPREWNEADENAKKAALDNNKFNQEPVTSSKSTPRLVYLDI